MRIYALAVRRRIAYYLLIGTKGFGALKRRLASSRGGFRGSADTWPPIVRKKAGRVHSKAAPKAR